MASYTEQTWATGVAGGTPLSAVRLQHLEDGVQAVGNLADTHTTAIASNTANIAAVAPNGGVRAVGKGELLTNVKDYGATGNGTTDDSAAIQLAINAAAANTRTVWFPPGTYLCHDLNLPDFTSSESSQSFNRPFKFLGATELGVTLKMNTNATTYLVGHPSVGGTTQRGQNSYLEIGNFTMIGTGDSTKNIPLIAVSNTYKSEIHNCHFEGVPGAPAIWNYSHVAGGSQGLLIRSCTTYKGQWTVTPGGNTVYDINNLWARSVRYFLHNDGPYDSVGKANDTIVQDCHVYDALIGCIDASGHGTTTYSQTFPSGGGTDNLRIQNCFFAAQGPRKMEQGTLTAVTDTSHVSLRTTSGEYANNTTNIFNNCVLRLQNPTTLLWEGHYITAFDPSTRTVTTNAAFSFTPTTSTLYRISYSDAAIVAAGWSADVQQHALLWDSWAYRARMSDCRYEEIRSIVATPNANYDVMVEFPYEVANDNLGGITTAGLDWRPRVMIADRPRGSNGAPVNISAPTIALSDPTANPGNSVILMHKINASGATRVNGDVVSLKTTDLTAVTSGNTNGTSVHGVVYNPQVSSFPNGSIMTVAFYGMVQVNVNTSVNAGDLICPTTSSQGRAVSPANALTIDANNNFPITYAIGRAIANASSGGQAWVMLAGAC